MSKGEKALRIAARALGGGTLLGVWVSLSDYSWLGDRALGETAALAALSLVLLLAVALGVKRCRKARYLSSLGRTATAYLTGALMGVAMGVLLLLLAELVTALVSMMVLRGFGG